MPQKAKSIVVNEWMSGRMDDVGCTDALRKRAHQFTLKDHDFYAHNSPIFDNVQYVNNLRINPFKLN